MNVAIPGIEPAPPHQFLAARSRETHWLRAQALSWRGGKGLTDSDIRSLPGNGDDIADLQTTEVPPFALETPALAAWLARIDQGQERMIVGRSDRPSSDLYLEDLFRPLVDPGCDLRRPHLIRRFIEGEHRVPSIDLLDRDQASSR